MLVSFFAQPEQVYGCGWLFAVWALLVLSFLTF